MIRNIVFDMGDVLLDYRPLTTCLRLAENPQEARLLCEAVFRIPQWEREYDQGTISEEDMLSHIQAPLPTQGLKERAARIFNEFHLDALTPHPGMEPLLQRLLDRGFSLYLLSNTALRFERFRRLIPCVDRFQGLLLSAQEHLLKPSLAIYQRFCEKFSCRPEECLFIDDRQVNIDGAMAAGMAGYCFEDGDAARLQVFLEALPEPKG